MRVELILSLEMPMEICTPMKSTLPLLHATSLAEINLISASNLMHVYASFVFPVSRKQYLTASARQTSKPLLSVTFLPQFS